VKRGIAAPAKHPLRIAIERHKARLHAEFTKSRLRRGFATLDLLRDSINAGSNGTEDSAKGGDCETSSHERRHPRWVRVNTLRTTLQEQLSTTFASYEQRGNLTEVIAASGKDKIVHVDQHIPNLLAFPPQCDLFKSKAYQEGKIIFQDKASCFPAYLLDFEREIKGDIIDACAAPGNKTTHLAAIGRDKKIFAFERNKQRTETLKKMVALAGAEEIVTIRGSTDFLSTKPSDFQTVSGILLDPSCSGSGIVGRDDEPQLFLPSKDAVPEQYGINSKKRKRNQPVPAKEAIRDLEVVENEKEDENEALVDRLASLSAFQAKILDHAMRFPNAKKIIYSTCSIHAEENENVVIEALASDAAREFGWRILLRPAQAKGLRKWDSRGDVVACQKAMHEYSTALAKSSGVPFDVHQSNDQSERMANGIANACIRCERGTNKGTMGFFVAGFVRNTDEGESYDAEHVETGLGFPRFLHGDESDALVLGEDVETKGDEGGGSDEVELRKTLSARVKHFKGKDVGNTGPIRDSGSSDSETNERTDNSEDECNGSEHEQDTTDHAIEEEWTGFSDEEDVAENDDPKIAQEITIEQKRSSSKQDFRKKRKESKKERLKQVEKAGSWCQ
jgi:putative methyltransferase